MTEREARGGPQRIPRPTGTLPGGPAPWAGLIVPDLSLSHIESRLAQRGPAVVNGASPEGHHRRSAVLVPLYESGGETWVILTRRSPHMRSHTHEVSFPGGRIDSTDDSTWAAALREAHEEVALDPALPRPIGELDSFITGGSQTFVTPLVAALPDEPELEASEAEVEHILHVSLNELLLPEVFREELWTRGESGPWPVTFFELHGDTVWGATAAMLRQLLVIVSSS